MQGLSPGKCNAMYCKVAECYEEGRRVHLSPYRQVPNVQRGSRSHSTGTRSRHTEFAGTGSYSNPQSPAIWISLHLLNKTPREDMGASQLPHIFTGFYANTRPHLFCLECAERLFWHWGKPSMRKKVTKLLTLSEPPLGPLASTDT